MQIARAPGVASARDEGAADEPADRPATAESLGLRRDELGPAEIEAIEGRPGVGPSVRVVGVFERAPGEDASAMRSVALIPVDPRGGDGTPDDPIEVYAIRYYVPAGWFDLSTSALRGQLAESVREGNDVVWEASRPWDRASGLLDGEAVAPLAADARARRPPSDDR